MTGAFSVQGPWFRHPLRVPLYEVDLGQGVYHGNYFHLFELGREAFLRHLDYPYKKLMERGCHLTVAEVRCVYLAPLRYDESIVVCVGVHRVGRRSLSLVHCIERTGPESEKEVTTRALMHLVCVDPAGSVPLPRELVSKLTAWIHSE